MGNQLGDHDEVKVGGPLDDERLKSIMIRAFRMRNLGLGRDEVLTCRYPDDGETPLLVHCHRDVDGELREEVQNIEIHMGCGEMCPVAAVVPYDGDSGGCDRLMAEAIAHAGRDLIDLVREVMADREIVGEIAKLTVDVLHKYVPADRVDAAVAEVVQLSLRALAARVAIRSGT